jgi:hypothetical protein
MPTAAGALDLRAAGCSGMRPLTCRGWPDDVAKAQQNFEFGSR